MGLGGSRIPRFDGADWSPVLSPVGASVYAIAGVPGQGLILVGAFGATATLVYPGALP